MVGRKRSHTSKQAILKAALDAVNSQENSTVSIESIAREAGVGKQTIYRWWPSLGELVLEALCEDAREHIDETEDPADRGDLVWFLSTTFRRLTEKGGSGRAVRWLMARTQTDPELRDHFYADFIKGRREALERVIRAGHPGPSLTVRDVAFLIDLVFGAMWYRLLVGHADLDDDLAKQLAELVCRERDHCLKTKHISDKGGMP